MVQPFRVLWSRPRTPDEAWRRLENQPGVYRWHLASGSTPHIEQWPSHLEQLGEGSILYIGRAVNLRARAPHNRKASSGSSFRRNLAGVFGLQARWHGQSAHPKLTSSDETWLTTWMESSLVLSWAPVPAAADPSALLSALEKGLRKKHQPPFNLDNRTEAQRYVAQCQDRLVARALRREGCLS